jgi:hypothetical protein
MNKIIYALIVIGLVSSCNQQETIQPKQSYESEINALNNTLDAAIDFSFKNFTKNISKTGKAQIDYDQKLSILSTLETLDGTHFIGNNFQYSLITDNFSTVRLPEVQSLNGRVNDFNIDQYNSFTSQQKEIAEPFIGKLLSLENLELVSSLSSDFNLQISNSVLSEDEKLELFALSAASNALSKFLANGGIDVIYLAISENSDDNSSTNGRVKDCSVNWRNVWLGGVVGFFSGGAYGGYVGCTGGTVVLPGVGTAAGCVGGAVLGAAGGFIGGSVSGVASELLGSCFR